MDYNDINTVIRIVGIGSQLSEIQKQLNHVKVGTTPHTRSPEQVAAFLKLKKDTMFLEFEHGVHSYIQKYVCFVD